MAAFMQQEFNIAVATMNVKPTSSFMMHIFIHGYAEFIQSQVKIVVNNALLLIIRAATKERKIIALTISTSSSSIYYTLFFIIPLLKSAQLMQAASSTDSRDHPAKEKLLRQWISLLLVTLLVIISFQRAESQAGRIFFFSSPFPLFSFMKVKTRPPAQKISLPQHSRRYLILRRALQLT